MINVRLPDGSERSLDDGASAADLAASIGPGLAKAAVAAKVNGDIVDLNGPLVNGAEGRSYGAELAVDAKPTDRWTLRSAASWSRGRYQSKEDGSDLTNHEYYPEYQFNLRSYYDIAEDWELDMGAYFVEDMGDAFAVAERWRLDLRVGWQPTNDLQLYVGAQQLNENTESEFDEFDNRRRQFYFGLKWTPGSDGGE